MKPEHGATYSRVLTFKLGASGKLAAIPEAEPIPDPPPMVEDKVLIEQGSYLFGEHCSYCHGVSAIGGGTIPDLRHSAPVIHDNFQLIVGQGLFEAAGMPSFKERNS